DLLRPGGGGGGGWPLSAIRQGDCVDGRHHLEQPPSTRRPRADARRCHADLARIGLSVSDELGNGFGRNRWIDLEDEWSADHPRDRRDVAEKNEIQLVIERRVDRVGWRGQEKRIDG